MKIFTNLYPYLYLMSISPVYICTHAQCMYKMEVYVQRLLFTPLVRGPSRKKIKDLKPVRLRGIHKARCYRLCS